MSIEVAFATPTELKPQFILPLSYESGRFRLQAQLKEARRHIVSWPNTQIWEFGQALLPVRTWGGSEMQWGEALGGSGERKT